MAVTRGTDPHIFLVRALQEAKLTEKDIKLVLLQHPDGRTALIRVEQVGDVFDLPLTVAVQYRDGRTDEITLKITSGLVEERIPTKGVIRRVVARDELSLYEIVR